MDPPLNISQLSQQPARSHNRGRPDQTAAFQETSQLLGAHNVTKRKHSAITTEEDVILCDKQGRIINLSGTQSDLYDLGMRCISTGHYAEGLRYFRLAGNEGQAGAQCYLGKCFKEGTRVPRDAALAFHWFQRAAQQSNVEAQLELGVCYYHGFGTDQRLAEAHRLFRLVADAGTADTKVRASAWFWLAECHRYGVGVKMRLGEAVRLYKLAASQGHEQAKLHLGLCLQQDVGLQREVDFAEAVQRVAELNTAQAQFELAMCYYHGLGTIPQPSESLRLLRLAADSNLASAQFWLGVGLHEGYGANKDLTEAVMFYKLAADQGHSWAQLELGYCLSNGIGVNRNRGEALRLHELAARQQNSAFVLNNLGYMYENGDGFTKDYITAASYFELALALDQESTLGGSYFNLGRCHQHGLGVTKDWMEALRLYRIAAGYGHARAPASVEELEAALKNAETIRALIGRRGEYLADLEGFIC